MKKVKSIFLMILCYSIIILISSCSGESKHTHSYTYKSNDTQHWQECSCGEKQYKEDHVFGQWTTTQEPTVSFLGSKKRTCEICQYEQVEELELKEPDDPQGLKCSLNEDKKSYTVIGIDLAANDTMIDIIIPSTYAELPVTSIGSSAFFECSSLESITIPDSVTSIGVNAFYNCSNLKNLTIGNNVTSIGNNAFHNCSIEMATIPTSLIPYIPKGDLKEVIITGGESIGNNAFIYSHGLESITIPDSVISIGEHAFSYSFPDSCFSLTNVYYEGTIEDWCHISFYDSLSSPMYYANHFYLRNSNNEWEEMTSIDIPDTITEIGQYQFYGFNNVTSIVIPDSVKSIGSGAFSYCSSLESIIIPNNVTSIEFAVFYGCSSLESIVVPDSVASIGNNAFYNCSSLKSIKIPDNVTSIGEWSFYNCSSLESITIPDNVTSIGERSFYNCSSLESITIPNSASIGKYAFSNCDNIVKATLPISAMNFISSTSEKKLKEVIITSGTNIGKYTFSSCSSLTSITIPVSVTSIGEEAFFHCSLKNIYYEGTIEDWCHISFSIQANYTIFSSFTSNNHFYLRNNDNDWEEMTSINIPDTITEIGQYQFSGFNSVTSITISNSVTSIGSRAFSRCSSLTSITCPFVGASLNEVEDAFLGYIFGATSYQQNLYFVPESLNEVIITGGESIVASAFSGCSSLESITITESVTNIGKYAFSGCNNLTSVTIGNNVTSIGESAFSGCSNLENVCYEGNLEDWCNINFYSIGDSNPMFYASYFCIRNSNYEWEEVTSIEIPNTVTEIGTYQFCGFDNVTSITIPDSVTSIGNGAFYMCYRLVEIFNYSSLSIFKGSTNNGSIGYYAKVIYTIEEESNLITKDNYVFFKDSSNKYNLVKYSGIESNIILPKDIEGNNYEINQSAFRDCSSLESITIPNSVKSIGESAFSGCSNLENVFYEGTIENWCNISIISNPVYYASHFYLKNSNDKWEEVTSIEIPNTVTGIGTYQFCGFDNVTSITIPDSVRIIGASAFSGCSSIESITIPNNLTSIGERAFSGCSSLESITIPNSVTTIGMDAFSGCSNLENVYYEGTIENWCRFNFGTLGNFPNPMRSANHFYLRNSNNEWEEVINIEIPNTITKIGNYQFYGFDNVTSIVIPDSVRSIGYDAFAGCNSLTAVTIGNKVTSIDYNAFDNCNNLENVYYEGNIEDWCKIGFAPSIASSTSNPMKYASHFYIRNSNNEWEEVTSIEIPDTITEIGNYQFYGFDNVTSITIPDSVTSIGESAFSGCSNLENVYYEGTIENWCRINFAVYSNPMKYASHLYLRNSNNEWEEVTSVEIPNTITIIGKYQFEGFSNITTLTIPDSVTIIGDHAFSDCSNLISVTMGNSVINIGYYIFSNCSSLISIIIPNSVINIRAGTFSGCSSLISIIIPNGVKIFEYNAFSECSSLIYVYYASTSHEWNQISIDSSNENLTSAIIYYYSETQPTEEGNFWHYVNGLPTIWDI